MTDKACHKEHILDPACRSWLTVSMAKERALRTF